MNRRVFVRFTADSVTGGPLLIDADAIESIGACRARGSRIVTNTGHEHYVTEDPETAARLVDEGRERRAAFMDVR